MVNLRESLRGTLLIARRQLGSIREDRHILLLLAVVVALGVTAAFGARHHASGEAEKRARYQEMVDQQWVDQPDRHPHRVIHYGFLVFRDEAPLSFFDPGVADYTGTSIFLEGHRQNTANFGEARHATGLLRFGRLTPAGVLALLMPLFVIIAGFSSVTSERERGTLRLLLAQGATPAQLLSGKILATAVVAGLAAVPIAAATGILAVLQDASLARLLTLGAVYAVYLGGWVLVTVLVSSVRARSRSALAQLVALWVLVCVATPRLTATLAETLHPLPSRAEATAQLEVALNEVGDSHKPDDPFFRALRDEYLERYQVSSVEELPVNWGGVVSKAGEEVYSQVWEEHRMKLVGGHRRQNDVMSWAGLISPYLAARELSMDVAGSGPEAAEAFLAQAEEHRYNLIQSLNDLHISEIRYENDRGQRVSREHWTETPVFEVSPPTLGAALAGGGLPLTGLALWTGLPLLGLTLVRRRLPRVGSEGS